MAYSRSRQEYASSFTLSGRSLTTIRHSASTGVVHLCVVYDVNEAFTGGGLVSLRHIPYVTTNQIILMRFGGKCQSLEVKLG